MSDAATPQGRFAALAREDSRGALVTVLEGPGLGSKLLVLPDGTREGSLGSPELDDAALIIALRSQAGYIGAMGSRRAQECRRERLLAMGVTDEEMERISAPIGLDLGALTAEETALSIMAEIVAMRYGRDGGRLAHAKGRIHEVGV